MIENIGSPDLNNPNFDVFFYKEAIAINKARLEHLSSLQLPLYKQKVLEVGAGIGLLTEFFEDQCCDILSTDGNPENVREIMRRYPNRKVQLLNLDTIEDLTYLGEFDVIFCYGTLYHLQFPEKALMLLSQICKKMILIETCVSLGKYSELHLVEESVANNMAVSIIGCRPTRQWVLDKLNKYYGNAYISSTQPNFTDFETNWDIPKNQLLHRAIFVGSKVPLLNQHLLKTITDKPDILSANTTFGFKGTVNEKVWFDVGAHLGETSFEEAKKNEGLTVYAFEPNLKLASQKAGLLANYIVIPMAVSTTNSFSRFYVNEHDAASSLLPFNKDGLNNWIGGEVLKVESNLLVPTIRIDTFMEMLGLSKIDYMKVDTQGNDFNVILSAGDRLCDISKITVEVTVTDKQLYAGAADRSQFIDYMIYRGFEVQNEVFQTHNQEINIDFINSQNSFNAKAGYLSTKQVQNTCIDELSNLKVGLLSPTTIQFVEKMAEMFRQGVEVVGPLSDDRHYWNDYSRRLEEWKEVGLNVTLNIAPYSQVDFSKYDLLIESVETFSYSKDWVNHCHRIECPIILKACWTKDPSLLPASYIEKVKDFPLFLEMPSHATEWANAGFSDVNVVFNPVGHWWIEREWTGEKEQVLFVLSGVNSWRGDLSWHGFDIWEKLQKRFPGKTYHHDGHVTYRNTTEMTKLFAESRVYVTLDKPYGQGERPLTLAFTEALSAGLPVVARDLPGLNYSNFIDTNGICTENFEDMCAFIDRCLSDRNFAAACSKRSKQIAFDNFSREALLTKYSQAITRATEVFNRTTDKSAINHSLPTSQNHNVFDYVANKYASECPKDYQIEESVKTFYDQNDYWKTFSEWEATSDSYSIRDKAFVESVYKIDGRNIVNIGCYYPWAEIEWGARSGNWIALDINPSVLHRAKQMLSKFPRHNVLFIPADLTSKNLNINYKFNAVLDLSTFDQIDPRKWQTVLENYIKLSTTLIMAYDATKEPIVKFDFNNYGFNALINPNTIEEMLKSIGYKIVEHRPFSYHTRSYIFCSSGDESVK